VFVRKISEFLLVVIFVVVDLQNSLKVQCGGILYLPSISVRNLTWVISNRNKTVSYRDNLYVIVLLSTKILPEQKLHIFL
jgi:hypothetical protein